MLIILTFVLNMGISIVFVSENCDFNTSQNNESFHTRKNSRYSFNLVFIIATHLFFKDD